MKKFSVSIDDITDALEGTTKSTLVDAIVVDHLGEAQRDSEQFGRHVHALKNYPHNTLVQAAIKLAIKYSSSISESNGCFLDKDRTVSIDFEGALTVRLESLLSELDSSLSNSNPAACVNTARSIVRDWQEAKFGTPMKHSLSNDDLSIEYRVGSTRVAITPNSRIPDGKLMEASPILNEMSACLKTLSERKLGRSIPEQGFSM